MENQPAFRQAQTCTECDRGYVRAPDEEEGAFSARRTCPTCTQAKKPFAMGVCAQCGGEFTQNMKETVKNMRARRYCSRKCGARSSIERRKVALKRFYDQKI